MNDLSKQDVLLDVGVQRAYLDPASPHCCVNAGAIFRNLKRLMAYARWAKAPLLSCVDMDCANRIGEGFVPLRGAAAPLAQRYAFGLMHDHCVVECDNSLCVALDLLSHHQQALLTKVHRDPYTNPKLDRLLTEMRARRFVVFGVPLESSVRMLVLGLLRRGRKVLLIDDACGYYHPSEAALVLRKLLVKGCQSASTLAYIREQAAAMSRVRPTKLRDRRSVA